VLAITPVGLRTYRFRLGNPSTNDKQRVTVAVACRKLATSGRANYKLRPRSLRSTTVTTQPGKPAGASLACPSGTAAAAGVGADLDPSRQNSAGVYGGELRVSIRRQTSTLSRFSFSVQNTGSQARTVVCYGGCVTLTRARSSARTSPPGRDDVPRRRAHRQPVVQPPLPAGLVRARGRFAQPSRLT
jgi:hypothetical protein